MSSMSRLPKIVVVALTAAAATWLVAPVSAAPISPLGLQTAVAPSAETVQYRRGWGPGGGWRRGGGAFVPGIIAGGIIGGAIAATQPYGYYGYGGYDPGYAYGPGYGYGPGYAAAPYAGASPYAGDEVAYCQQRFRSYDPRSGTYLGYDGLRHPCP
jgi:BA14K-like protein